MVLQPGPSYVHIIVLAPTEQTWPTRLWLVRHGEAWGVYLHAKAGDALARKMGLVGFLARELKGEVPGLLAQLPSGAPQAVHRT
jgi:hypothetical protein